MITRDQIKIGSKVKKNPNGPVLTVTAIWSDGANVVNESNGDPNAFFLVNYEDLLLHEEPTADTPLNPSHYQVNGEQVWDQMLRLFGPEKMKAFCEVNAYKYFSRAGKKAGNPLEQDMEKATWYLRKLRELENDK